MGIGQHQQQQEPAKNPNVGFEDRNPPPSPDPTPEHPIPVRQFVPTPGKHYYVEGMMVVGVDNRTDAEREREAYNSPAAKEQRERDAAQRKAYDDLNATLVAAHLADDKLALAHELYEQGGRFLNDKQEVMTLDDFKRATLAFALERSGDSEWTLHRYEFRGDAMTSSTWESFNSRPGPQHYR
ncbi:MAG: hypothetical protein QM831_36830 [Kofleriaceae bacterium]